MSAAFGILIMCYVQVSPGQYDWVKGREVAGDELILFKADGRKAEYVNSNNCKYLEDPVTAYAWMLEQKEQMNRETASATKENIDKRTTGDKQWCLVDEYGRRRCTYKTMQECLQRIDKLSYCEEREPGSGIPKESK
jgi:hypothetical protein